MFIRLLGRLKRMWTRWMRNPFYGVRLSPITDEELCFDPDVERIIRECEFRDAFRSFGSLEDYNRDFAVFFKCHRSEFYLDYSQKDGHFRV